MLHPLRRIPAKRSRRAPARQSGPGPRSRGRRGPAPAILWLPILASIALGCAGDDHPASEDAARERAGGGERADSPSEATMSHDESGERAANTLSAEERAAGWRLLFDGETTRGWRGFRRKTLPDGWQVVDGALARTGAGGDIVSEDEFADFELELEWRVSEGGNSGIFFRVGEEADSVWRTGPEMQVLDNGRHPDGGNPLTSAGSNYALHAPARDATRPVGEFNRARIVARGAHVEHWLNGEKLLEYELWSPEWEELVSKSKFASLPRYGRLERGRIALQDHGDPVWFRDIKIRELPSGEAR